MNIKDTFTLILQKTKKLQQGEFKKYLNGDPLQDLLVITPERLHIVQVDMALIMLLKNA